VPLVSVVASELAFFLRLARLGTREPINAIQVEMPTIPEPVLAYTQFSAP